MPPRRALVCHYKVDLERFVQYTDGATMVHNPHNALFHYTFSNPEHAVPALRAILPAALVARMDFSTLALEAGHFVDETLRGRYTDLLFSVKIDGQSAFIYVLFEHQSYADRFLLLRLLEYKTRIWRAHVTEQPKAKRIPVIVAVIEYLQSITMKDREEVVMAVSEVIGGSLYERMVKTGERLQARWKQKSGADGRAPSLEEALTIVLEDQAEQIAIRRGQRSMLLRQLRTRFGELPKWAEAQVSKADFEELDAIADRILTASTLAEALGKNGKPRPKASGRRSR